MGRARLAPLGSAGRALSLLVCGLLLAFIARPTCVWATATSSTLAAASPHACCLETGGARAASSPWSVRVGDRAFYCGQDRGDLRLEWSSTSVECSCEVARTATSCNETSEWFRDAEAAAAAGRFACGGRRLPLGRVNDEYCDCGADEPATAACSGGKFACAHRSSVTQELTILASSRVRDGVPDCCDCSDEPGHPECRADGCEAKERELRRRAAARRLVWERGMHRRAEIAEALEARLSGMRAELSRLQASEAEDAPALLAQEAHERAAAARDALWRSEAAMETSELYKHVEARPDVVLAEWALRLADGATARASLGLPACAPETCAADSAQELLTAPGFTREKIWELAHSKGALELSRVLSDAPPALLARLERVHADAERAKARYEELAGTREANRARIQEITSKLAESLRGEDLPAFMRHWNDVSYKKQLGEYEYALDVFKELKQGATLVGTYAAPAVLAGVKVPPELREGEEVPEPSFMARFEKGAKCFNGVLRSATVYARCGPEDELLKIVEPETCKYDVLIQSPAACFGAADQVRPRTFWEALVARVKRIFG